MTHDKLIAEAKEWLRGRRETTPAHIIARLADALENTTQCWHPVSHRIATFTWRCQSCDAVFDERRVRGQK